ncbi:FBP domain-containing protein [Nocardioides sp. MAHUQ-72]|uniref:FBP domain-containing protein n=1 Tax=unclassified Nocardioides TaxID=2615069 RepID=UPI00361D9CCC
MDSISERDIRASFVNCTRGEVSRMRLPPDLETRPWEQLDFLGWVDPRSPLQAYVVVPVPDGRPVGVALRRNASGEGPTRSRMCSLCVTTHPGTGVTLMVAARAGRAGRDGNSVGVDVCADLECSRYVRGLLPAPSLTRVHETLSVEQRTERLRRNLLTFVGRL